MVHEYSVCFQYLAIINNTAKTTFIEISCGTYGICTCIYIGYVLQIRITFQKLLYQFLPIKLTYYFLLFLELILCFLCAQSCQ